MSKKLKPRYYGKESEHFWATVNALKKKDHGELYSLGCALQDLEHRVLVALENAKNGTVTRVRGIKDTDK